MLYVVWCLLGLVVGMYVQREYIDPRPSPDSPSKLATALAEVAALKAQLDDAATAAEVEGDVLAMIAARGWEVTRADLDYHRMARFSMHLSGPDADSMAKMRETWTVGQFTERPLAKAWALACASHDAAQEVERKMREQFPEGTPDAR